MDKPATRCLAAGLDSGDVTTIYEYRWRTVAAGVRGRCKGSPFPLLPVGKLVRGSECSHETIYRPTDVWTLNDRQVEQIAQSIREFGFVNPVLVGPLSADSRRCHARCLATGQEVCSPTSLAPAPSPLVLRFPHSLLAAFNFDTLAFDTQTNSTKNAHVEISNPDQRKARNEIAAPIVEEKLVSRDYEEKSGDVMTKAVFTREQEEEFPFEELPADFTVLRAPIPRFAKYLLMGYRP